MPLRTVGTRGNGLAKSGRRVGDIARHVPDRSAPSRSAAGTAVTIQASSQNISTNYWIIYYRSVLRMILKSSTLRRKYQGPYARGPGSTTWSSCIMHHVCPHGR